MKNVWIFCLALLLTGNINVQAQSDLQRQAEEAVKNNHPVTGRYTYVRAYEEYFEKGQLTKGVQCAIEAAKLYCSQNAYQEAFDLLYQVDQAINAKGSSERDKALLHYMVSKERMTMYQRISRPKSALEHVYMMEKYAALVNDSLKNDALYYKAICFYSSGETAKGNAVFREMSDKLTASKEYDKVDKVYQKLIENSRRNGSAGMLAQTYKSYLAWKDSTNALKMADELGALKKQIAAHEASIAEKDSTLTTRQVLIVSLCILALALAAALVVGGIVLLRFIVLTRKQKKLITTANENNALKAKFISNISAQLDPTLQKLDAKLPEVKALKDFSSHIQTLSQLENSTEELEKEDVQIQSFCEEMMDQIRDKVKKDVTLKVNAPKMSVTVHKAYVSHILSHLLHNAAEYTPEGGTIWLDYKKRGAHSHQFIVSDTGCGIPEEKQENVFKPFLEIHDLTKGDGLGLPTCMQMALKMDGDLHIDGDFTKGTRFILDLHA